MGVADGKAMVGGFVRQGMRLVVDEVQASEGLCLRSGIVWVML